MPGFPDFVGTPFLSALLPIIPHGAPLSAVTDLTPDRIGKIPGLRVADGWKGFQGWTSNTFRPEQAAATQGWFHDRPYATIGHPSR